MALQSHVRLIDARRASSSSSSGDGGVSAWESLGGGKVTDWNSELKKRASAAEKQLDQDEDGGEYEGEGESQYMDEQMQGQYEEEPMEEYAKSNCPSTP